MAHIVRDFSNKMFFKGKKDAQTVALGHLNAWFSLSQAASCLLERSFPNRFHIMNAVDCVISMADLINEL